MYIVSQIVATFALILTITSYHLDNKKKIFKRMCLANILEIVHYLLLNAYSGCLTKIVALIRNIFIILKEKNKKLNNNLFLLLFLIIYLFLAFIAYNGLLSLFPIFAAMIYLLGVWDGDEKQVKLIAFLCYFIWLIYNIYILSIVGILSNTVSLLSTLIAYNNS